MMNLLIRNIFVFCILFAQTVSAQNADKPFVEIGVVDLSRAQAKIVMGAETATRPGIFVHLIFVDPSASSVLLTRQKLGWEIAEDENSTEDVTAYTISGSEKISGLVGFVLYGPILDFAVVDGVPEIDLTGDGMVETLSACLTSEGIRLDVQSGKNGTTTSIWQKYVPLPFDVEANCK